MKSVLDFFVKHQIDIYNQKIAVACSGGADSMALLRSLLDLKKQLQFKIHVLHFNHNLRGKDSDQDLQFVKSFCKKENLAFHNGSAQVKNLAKKDKKSIEVSAREARYAWFEKTLKKENITYLFTAHHADDQTETLFLNFIRGTGLEGLKGIQPVSFRKHYTLLRPLIDQTKKELEAYLKHKKIEYRDDSSNQDTAFWRNKIRHEILPKVREINPNVHKSLAQMVEIVRAELAEQEKAAQTLFQKCLTKKSAKQVSLDSATLYTLPKAQQRLVVRWACRELKGDVRDVSFEFVENFLKNQLNALALKNSEFFCSKQR